MIEEQTLEGLLDNPPKEFEGIARLWVWSSNFDYPSPATVFIDLIGYSDNEYGVVMTTMKQAVRCLGYMEIGMLADALNEYAERPNDARDYIRAILNAEGGE